MESKTPKTKKVVKEKIDLSADKAGKKPKAVSNSLEATIYNQKGASAGSLPLPKSVFGAKWNADLVHQVVTSIMANKRSGTAHTKNRGEVSGGGKKPWAQKGTGRARHGSSRSPIWVGGGVTFGPRVDKEYSQKINKKMRTKALFSALSKKLEDNKVLFVDSLALSAMKTKDAVTVLSSLSKISGFEKLGSKKPTTALLALSKSDKVVEKSFANLPGVTVGLAKDLNVLGAMSFNYIILVEPKESVSVLEAKLK